MNLGDDIVILETTSTEVKNRILKSHELLRAIDTGALYIGGKDGKPQALIASSTTPDGGIAYADGGIPIVSGFLGFSASVVASLVAGATAVQSGNTVTVTATAHGVPASQAGKRIYYPGSPNIAAGWYSSLAIVDANALTFQRPTSATVASESVNSGAAFTSSITVASATVKGGSLRANGRITARFKRAGDTTGATKTLLLALDGLAVGTTAMGATAYAIGSMTFWNGGAENLQYGNQEMDGRLTNVEYKRAVDTTVDKTLAIAAGVSAAGGWVSIDAVEIEHVSRA